MMGIMDLDQEIRDRELELVSPQHAGLRSRHQPMASPEIEQNICSLRDHEVAGLEKGRSKWRILHPGALHQGEHLVFAAAPARDVDVVGPCFFEHETDEFTATLNLGPVVELVTHGINDPLLSIPKAGGTPRATRTGRNPIGFRAGWPLSGQTALPERHTRRFCSPARPGNPISRLWLDRRCA